MSKTTPSAKELFHNLIIAAAAKTETTKTSIIQDRFQLGDKIGDKMSGRQNHTENRGTLYQMEKKKQLADSPLSSDNDDSNSSSDFEETESLVESSGKSGLLKQLKDKKKEQSTRDPEATLKFERSKIQQKLQKVLKKKDKLEEDKNLNKDWAQLLGKLEKELNDEGEQLKVAVQESEARRKRDLLAVEEKKRKNAHDRENVEKIKKLLDDKKLEFERQSKSSDSLVQDIESIMANLGSVSKTIRESQR